MSESSIPADLKEQYSLLMELDDPTIIVHRPWARGLIERIGRAEDRIAELKIVLEKIVYMTDPSAVRKINDLVRAALAAPSGGNTKEKV